MTGATVTAAGAHAATDSAVWQYLNDRAQFVQTPGPGGCTNGLTVSVSSLNDNGVVGYVGMLPGSGGKLGSSVEQALIHVSAHRCFWLD